MEDNRSFFEKVMFEAPGSDTPPDISPDSASSAGTEPPGNIEEPPDDIPSDTADSGSDPPDMGTDGSSPPDIEDPGFGDGSEAADDSGFGDDEQSQESGKGDQNQPMDFDEKISGIMNMNLYQRYLSLLNNIGGQLSMIKDNSDILYTLSNDSLNIINSLEKLDENIHLYLTNYFLNENYSKNLLFFNKCLNLLKLLNNVFEKNIQKGIKTVN